jgi:hypothetical protein
LAFGVEYISINKQFANSLQIQQLISMPLSSLAEIVLQPIVEIVFQVAGYITSRIVVPALTLGYVYVEPGPNKKWIKPSFGRVQRLPSGKLVMDAELGALVGIVFWVVVGVGLYFVFRES